ncbi:MAG: DNA polymerase III subunit alpha, partial [Planctomycetes bacterium]|nr:DNA polymerase III subunit alpha [Planctomycetota bacterium]
MPQAFLQRDRATAESLVKTYLSIFGPDRFFMELQDHSMPEQKTLNPELIDTAKRLGIRTIATNDVHYLEHSDVEAHDVLCCINTGRLVSDEDRFKFPSDQFYFKSTAEMSALFPDCPESISNTLQVADMCNLEIDLDTRHAPVFRVPENITAKDGTKLDDGAYLRQLVYEGAEERYPEISDELRERIDYELEVITGKGFASYFLTMWDCVNYARENGIPVGARGSGCSSVVAYTLFLSSPEPIRYGLYFERFMDPDRDEMPDIDLDICQHGRARLIDYVREKYGHVAQIITFGTLKARAAVKDVARVLGYGFDQANELTKLIPSELKMTLDKALQREPELKKQYDTDEKVKKIIDIARKVEGLARNAGIHAAGVVVADQPLETLLPLYKAAGQDGLITQFDGPTVERVGLLKMDFLGLRTLTTLERARQLAERSSGRSIDLTKLDLEDPNVYELFARGDTQGIFQFESGGMRDVIMRIKPNRIEDLIAANALYRPGPMEYIPDYIARKHGAAWSTPHQIMTEVLQETYGIMVYQEQVSRVVNQLGGIELKAAFRLAKAISKKKTEMIESMREPFLEGCAANGVKREVATQVFNDILKFGGYAFNKAHSTGYALIAFQTAWMKTYFPVEFMVAVMTFEMSS